MKNIDFKKLLVLIVIIAVAVLAIVGAKKLFENIGGPSKKVQAKINDRIENYFVFSSIGHSTIYDGIDLTYDEDKVEVKDISNGSMIELAIKYANENKKDIIADNDSAEVLNRMMKTETTGYNGEELRKIVKELFDVELPKDSIIADSNFLYNYYYIADNDTYVRAESETYNLNVQEQTMDFYVEKTKKNKNTYVTTVAVAYVYQTGDTFIYAKDKNGSTIVVNDAEKFEFPKDKVDEFTKYEFTTKEVDGNYVLVSIEKVK